MRLAAYLRAFSVLVVPCSMVAVSLAVAPDTRGLFGAALALLVVAIAVVDLRWFIIPNELAFTTFLLGMGNATMVLPGTILENLFVAGFRGLALAAAFLCLRSAYHRFRGRQGLGLGDVKLAAGAGAWLDWTYIPVAIEIAALSAIFVYLLRQRTLRRPLRATARLPFGLFLAPSIWLAWLAQTILSPF